MLSGKSIVEVNVGDTFLWTESATPQLLKELYAEQGIGLVEAARVAGQIMGRQPNGRPFTKRHVLAWIQQGIMVAGGKRLRLEGVQLPRCWASSAAALRRFHAACIGAAVVEQEKAERKRQEERRATSYGGKATPK
jgi:hypothetical protein